MPASLDMLETAVQAAVQAMIDCKTTQVKASMRYGATMDTTSWSQIHSTDSGGDHWPLSASELSAPALSTQ